MSIFKQVGSNGARNPSERFFGVVEAYEPDGEGNQNAVVRVKTASGQERKVALNPSSKISNLKEGYSRPPISDLVGKGRKAVAVGGTILVEDAYLDKKSGLHLARWVSAAVHKPGDGFVIEATAAKVSPLITAKESGKSYRTVDVLDTANAKTVKDAAAFESAIDAAIRGKGAALVRFADTTTGKIGTKLITGGNGSLSADERVAAAKGKEAYTQLRDSLAKGIEADEIVEIVPAQRLFFGGDTATQSRIDAIFVKTSDEGDRQFSKGYTSALIVAKSREDGSAFVTRVVPKSFDSTFTPAGEWAAMNGKKLEANAAAHDEAGEDLPPDLDLAELAGAGEDEQQQQRVASPGM